MTVIFFARLSECAGAPTLSIEAPKDTQTLVAWLRETYPGLKKELFMIAVDKHIIHDNTALHSDAVVALLPPYSGG